MENKEVKISFWASHLTTIVSVTLVLLIVGIIAMVWVGANNETRRLREQVELSAILADTVSNARANEIGRAIAAQPYSGKVRVVSKEEALKRWMQDTGEDLKALYGVNPLSPEVSFYLKADYNNAAKIKVVVKSLSSIPGVESVDSPSTDMVESMNSNISAMTWVLAIVAGVLLVISFVLINNTVQLTVHSRRFTIHTMKLVGATNGFICRPVVLNNMTCGLIAGILASLLLITSMACAPMMGLQSLQTVIGWQMTACICGGVILLGMALCSLTAWIATLRYLRKDYDELFH